MSETSKPPAARTARLQSAIAQLTAAMDRLVAETMESLSARGVDPAGVEPLLELRDAITALRHIASAPAGGEPDAARDERSRGAEASEELLARASATIDVLVQSGRTPEHAAQIVTRQLLSAGIAMPESGGDARAWKRLFTWRETLLHHKRSGPAWDAYCAFRDELAEIPPDERLRRVAGDRLWDMRERDAASRNSA